jgi:DNA-binding GntR family transcriptional regulator
MKEYTNWMSKATEQAYSIIREHILNGTYAPGAHLKEGELVERCKVSRTPVRDALRQLANERYVVTHRNQGVFVNQWTADDITDIFKLRAMLEAVVAERAAKRISPEQIAELKAIHTDIQTMLDQSEPPEVDFFLTKNRSFHVILIEAAQSRTLADTLSQIFQPPLIAQTARWYSHAGLQQSNDHHLEILKALEAGDGKWAASVMKAHIYAAQRKFMISYAEANET